MPDSGEPKRLRDGKAFHKRIQKDWKSAEGSPRSERRCTKPDGRTGRIDIHVDASHDLAAVVEIKNTDWDRMTNKAVQRNVRGQARQIWASTVAAQGMEPMLMIKALGHAGLKLIMSTYYAQVDDARLVSAASEISFGLTGCI